MVQLFFPAVLGFGELEGGGGDGGVEGGAEEFDHHFGVVALGPAEAFGEGGLEVELHEEGFDAAFEFAVGGDHGGGVATLGLVGGGDFEEAGESVVRGIFAEAEGEEEGFDGGIVG